MLRNEDLMTAPFTTLAEFRAIFADLTTPDATAIAGATDRNGQLTKPQGALGRLEDLAIWYAGWRNDPRPAIRAPPRPCACWWCRTS